MSTIFVDNLQPNLGSQVEIPQLKPLVGSVIQVVNHKTTTRLASSGVGGVSTGNTIAATDGVTYTTFNFTPIYANSKLLLLSSTFAFGESVNSSDTVFAAASYGGTTIIGTVMNYLGYSNWGSNHDSAFASFNHYFNSWGTDTRTIRVAVGGSSSGSNFVLNYPNQSDTAYVGQYASQHDVTFTVMEIAQ